MRLFVEIDDRLLNGNIFKSLDNDVKGFWMYVSSGFVEFGEYRHLGELSFDEVDRDLIISFLIKHKITHSDIRPWKSK